MRRGCKVEQAAHQDGLQLPVTLQYLLKQECRFEKFAFLAARDFWEWKLKPSTTMTTTQKLKPHSKFAPNCLLWLFYLCLSVRIIFSCVNCTIFRAD